MIGRGRVISLTPSGAHLGAGQELSDLPHPQPFQKVQRITAILAPKPSYPTALFCIAKRSIVKAERRTRMKVKLQIEG